jgi:hypothetical protein
MKPTAAKSSADVAIRALSALQADMTDLARRLDMVATLVREALQTGEVGPVPRRVRTPRKRPAPPAAGVVADRLALWSRYVLLNMSKTGSFPSKLFFASTHNLNPSEFSRWFSANGRRGIPAGSAPDISIRRALEQAIHELEDVPVPKPHGPCEHCQSAIARRQ